MNKEIINQPCAIVHSLLLGLSDTPLSSGATLFTETMKNANQDLLPKQGVYKITNIKRNRIYIGSTSRSFRSRFTSHLKDLRNNNHHSHKLQSDYILDGLNSFIFEIIQITTPQEAVSTEQKYLDTLDPYYNILKRADSCLGHKMTPEQCIRISIAKSKKINEGEVISYYLEYGSKKTVGYFHIGGLRINKILLAHNITKHKSGVTLKYKESTENYDPEKVVEMYRSGASIRNIRKKMKTDLVRVRKTLKDNNIEIIKHPPLNKEQLIALSKALEGRVFSEQWKSNIAKGKIGKKVGGDNGNARRVLNTKTGVIYSSIRDVSEIFAINNALLSDRLHGHTKNDTPFVLLKKNGIMPDIKPYIPRTRRKLCG